MTLPPELPATFAVIRDGAGASASFRGAFVAIGNFDGVHRGHREVIRRAQEGARAAGAKALALTFEPHPRTFFKPEEPVFRLSPEPAKLRLLAQTGLDGAVVMRFDASLAALEAEAFVETILCGSLGIGGAVAGHDFHFGRQRQGTPAFLREAGTRHGFAVEIVEPFTDSGTIVSSGEIRAALAEGDLARARDRLGYDWFVSGEVVHGEKRGRELGYPTANLVLDPSVALRHGIYAVRVRARGKSYGGVASFGRRPQFDNGAPLLEPYLFGFAGDLYGTSVDVEFLGFIRPELKFASVDALIAEMKRDEEQARAILG
jgi:riboflavin kinase/FMN adenylyltransferase